MKNVSSSENNAHPLKRKVVSTIDMRNYMPKTVSVASRKNRVFEKQTGHLNQVDDTCSAQIVSAINGGDNVSEKIWPVTTRLEEVDSASEVELPATFDKSCEDVSTSLAKEDISALDRLIRLPELMRMISISKSSIYDRLDPDSKRYDPTFPKQRKKGRTALWKLSEVVVWMNREPTQGEV